MDRRLTTGLHCTLTNYLEEASCADGDGSNALYAAVLLSCLAYPDPANTDQSIELFQEILKALQAEHHDKLLNDISTQCRGCLRNDACPVGNTIGNHIGLSREIAYDGQRYAA